MTQQIAQQVMLPTQQIQQAFVSPVRPGQIGPAHKANPKRTRKNFIFYYSVDNDNYYSCDEFMLNCIWIFPGIFPAVGKL